MRDKTLALLGQTGIAAAKPGFVDRLIHANYSSEGVSLVTFEKAAGKLANVQLLAGIEETNES